MPFEKAIAEAVDNYAKGDIRPREWFDNHFDFIEDDALRARLASEFYSARYIYKLLEGLAVENELLAMQVRLQVLQFASIYEAVLHHLLFDRLVNDPRVQALLSYDTLKKYSIPPSKEEMLRSIVHDGREIVPAYYGTSRVTPQKVRFDDKAICAREIGLIDSTLCDDLIEIYEMRNAIHLDAEIRKGILWGIEMSMKAYLRNEPFKEQIVRGLAKYQVDTERDRLPGG